MLRFAVRRAGPAPPPNDSGREARLDWELVELVRKNTALQIGLPWPLPARPARQGGVVGPRNFQKLVVVGPEIFKKWV